MSTELVKWENAKQAIAECRTLDEVKEIRDRAEAMRAYAKQAKESLTAQNDLCEIKLRAERRAGEMLRESNLQQGSRGYGKKVELQDVTPLSDYGIQKHESSRWQKIASIPEDSFDEIITETKQKQKELTESMMLKLEKEINKKDKLEEEKEKGKDFKSDSIQIYNEDFRQFEIENDSIDLILTDPPYPKEHLHLWEDLFDFAFQKLKPSSFLVAYTGQMYLDKIFRMKNDLIYYWLMNIEFTKKPLIRGRNVINEWKPIFVFQKPPFKKVVNLNDKIPKENAEYNNEREMHKENWGQTVAPFEFLLERFSSANDLVFEPFAGTGTTLVACKNKKRRCIGTEIETDYIDLIKGRLK